MDYRTFFRTARKILNRTAIAIAASGTTFSLTNVLFGGVVATRYVLECYDSDGNVTRTLSIVDANGVTVWSGAAHADATKPSIPIDVELEGTYTLTLTLSGPAGGSGGNDYLTVFGR